MGLSSFLRARGLLPKRVRREVISAAACTVESLENRTLLAVGLYDTTFGVSGSVVTDMGGATDVTKKIALQSDGKILVAGDGGASTSLAVARYTAAGSLDLNFGTSGKIVAQYNSEATHANAVVVLGNSQILVGGYAVGPSASTFVIARYNNDGTLDRSFGGNAGWAVTNVNGGDCMIQSLTVQADGKIIAAGTAATAGGTLELALVRYNMDGSIDTSFGNAGKVVTVAGTAGAGFTKVIMQADQKILVCGAAAFGATDVRTVVARYQANGQLDTTFGTGGMVVGAQNTIAGATGMVLTPTGSVVIAGTMNSKWAVAGYTALGAVDTTFGTAGRTVTTFGPAAGSAWLCGLTREPSGNLILAGTVTGGVTQSDVIRFDAKGIVDTTFGISGAVDTTRISAGFATDVVLQGDNSILTSILVDRNSTTLEDFGVAKLTDYAPPTGTITGMVYFDANENGRVDGREYGLSQVRVYIDANSDGIFDNGDPSMLTDANGNYTFSNLTAGTYTVREVLPSASWLQTTPHKSAPLTITLATDISLSTGNNFGVFYTPQRGNITGTIFNDANGNGVQDNGELGLGGWWAFLDYNRNGLLDRNEPLAITNSNGAYTFAGVRPGRYVVGEAVPRGWRRTAPQAASVYYVTVGDAQTLTDITFGNTTTAAIGGHGFYDLNANGVQDRGERSLSGCLVFLDANNNGILDAGESYTFTDSSGNYSFKGLTPGKYVVRFAKNRTWRFTLPKTGYYSLTLTASQLVTNLNFAGL